MYPVRDYPAATVGDLAAGPAEAGSAGPGRPSG
jgi:hypothetical protein